MSTDKKAVSRWYVVSDKRDGARCLVEANNTAQAFKRTAQYYCDAHPATVAETIEMTRAECDVISATREPEQLDLVDEMTDSVVPVATPGAGERQAAPAETGNGGPADNVVIHRNAFTQPSRAADVFMNLPQGEYDGE